MAEQESGGKVFYIFQSLAAGYDRANDRISLGLHRRWKRRLVNRVSQFAPPNGAVLDICCGTGDIACFLAGQRSDLRVSALDFSPKMLAVAKAKAHKMANISWLEGDALHTPFGDNSFDCVTISFGLRNLPDWEKAAEQMIRLTKPGGRVFCLESFVPENPFARLGYRLYFSFIMPLLGGGFRKRGLYKWLDRSTQVFLSKEQLKCLLERKGLEAVSYQSYLLGSSALHTGEKKRV